MKKRTSSLKITSILLASLVLFASCASTTLIQSVPNGAKVYIDGQPVGTTPYSYSDTKIVGSSTTVRLEKDGYDPLNTVIVRNERADVGAIVGGLFFWVPFLWTMEYNPTHTYELNPSNSVYYDQSTAPQVQSNDSGVKTKAEKLSELKSLLDQQLISQEDYDKAKAKILSEEE